MILKYFLSSQMRNIKKKCFPSVSCFYHHHKCKANFLRFDELTIFLQFLIKVLKRKKIQAYSNKHLFNFIASSYFILIIFYYKYLMSL